MNKKLCIFLCASISLYSCTSSMNYKDVGSTISIEENNTETKPNYNYFSPSFDFLTFFFSDFYDCNKQRFNYIMTVKLQATPNYPTDDIIVYGYGRRNINDFQFIVTAKFNEDDILWYLKLTAPRNATLQQTTLRLSLFKIFDRIEDVLTSKYEAPWVSMNSLFKENSKLPDELYENWLSVGESMIEEGAFSSRWYIMALKNDEDFDLMSLKLTPDLIFEMYPILIKNEFDEKPF